MTLFELLIVIAMIGILSAIAMSKLDWKRYQADAAARGVMAELATGQRLALSLQANMIVTLPDTVRLQIVEDANNDGSVTGGTRPPRPTGEWILVRQRLRSQHSFPGRRDHAEQHHVPS